MVPPVPKQTKVQKVSAMTQDQLKGICEKVIEPKVKTLTSEIVEELKFSKENLEQRYVDAAHEHMRTQRESDACFVRGVTEDLTAGLRKQFETQFEAQNKMIEE